MRCYIKKGVREDKDALLILCLLLGIYLFPENIRLFSVLSVVGMLSTVLIYKYNLKIDYTVGASSAYIFMSMASMMYENVNTMDILKFSISILMGLAVYSINYDVLQREKHIDMLTLLGFIVMLGCILQIVFPEVLISINKFTLGSEKYDVFDMFRRGSFLVGFSFQTGITGYYLAVLSLILFLNYLNNRNVINKKVSILLVILAYTFTVFTGKRIFIILTLMISILMIAIYKKSSYIKIMLFSGIGFLLLYFLLYFTEPGTAILTKMELSDPTSGRSYINQHLFKLFFDSPLIGHGVTSTLHLLDGFQNGHNIYYQILSESGIIGFLLLVPMFIYNLYRAVICLFFRVKKGIDSKYLAISVALQCLFVGWGFTGNPLYDVYPLIIYYIAIGYANRIHCNASLNKSEYTV